MARRARRCRRCGRFVGPGAAHRHETPPGRSERERHAARLVRSGVAPSSARRRAGLGALPRYLTYRPKGRVARHLAADAGGRLRSRVAGMVPRRPRRRG